MADTGVLSPIETRPLPPIETLPQGWPQAFSQDSGSLAAGQGLVVAGDRLIGVTNNTLFAVDIYQGAPPVTSDQVSALAYPYAMQSLSGSTPHVAYGCGQVFFMDGPTLVALGIADGQPLDSWQSPSLNSVVGLFVVEDILVVVNEASGATFVAGYEVPSGATRFGPYRISEKSPGQIGFAGGRIFFVAKGLVHAVNTDYGDEAWTFANTRGGQLSQAAAPQAGAGVVVAASGLLHGIDLTLGRERWTVASQLGDIVNWLTPAVDETSGCVVGATSGALGGPGEVVAVSLVDGTVRWRALLDVAGAPIVQNGTVYIVTGGGAVLSLLALADGSVQARYNLGANVAACGPVVGNGTIFVPINQGEDSSSVIALPFSTQTAAYFDGSQSLIDISAEGAQFDLGLADFTVEAWVRTTQGGEVVSSYPTAGTPDDHGFRLNITPLGEIRVAIVNAALDRRNVGATEPTNAADGFWHHIVLLRRAGTLSALVDGLSLPILIPAAPDDPLSLGGNSALTIGAYRSAAGIAPVAHFAGLIREVRIWDRALDIATIKSIMKAELTGREPRLLGYWPLDEGWPAPTQANRPQTPAIQPRNSVARHRYQADFQFAAACSTDLTLDDSAFPYLLHEIATQWPFAGTWAARGEHPATTRPAVSDNGVLAFGAAAGTAGAIYGVRKRDGARLWSYDFAEGCSAPVASGRSFYALTGTDSVVVLDASSGHATPVAAFTGFIARPDSALSAPAVSGRYLAAAAPTGEVRIFDNTSSGAPTAIITAANPTALTISGDVLALVAGAEGARQLHVVSLPGGACKPVPVTSDAYVWAGTWIVCEQTAGLTIIDTAAGNQALRSTSAVAAIAGLAASMDADLLAVTSTDGTVTGLSLATLNVRWGPVTVPAGAAIGGIALNPPVLDDSHRVYVTSGTGSVAVLSGATGALLDLFFAPQPVITAPLVDAATLYYACADTSDPTAPLDGALHSVVFGDTCALRLNVDARGTPIPGGSTYAVVPAPDRGPAITTALSLLDVTACCVEAWINTPRGAGIVSGGGIVSVCPTDLSAEGSGGFDLNLWLDPDGTLHFSARDKQTAGWTGMHLTAATSLCDGQWHHVAVSRDADAHAILYVDGTALTNVTALPAPSAPATLAPGLKVFLGAVAGADLAATQFFTGLIGEVRVWDTYLQSTEIAERMHDKLRGDEPDLLAYWNFDRQSVHDGARLGHDGALVNTGTAPNWWLTDLSFTQPSYPFMTTAASIMTVGGQENGPADTTYQLVLKACRADQTALANTPITLWYLRHASDEPSTIDVRCAGQHVTLTGVASSVVPPPPAPAVSTMAITTGPDGKATLDITTSDLAHGPSFDLNAGFMPANERYFVNVLIDNQALAKPAPPNLTAQTKLLQDYHYSQGNKIDDTRDRSTYRTVITAADADHSPRPREPITLWASAAVDIEVEGVTYSINADNSAALVADLQGELTVVMEAGDISAPTLFAHAGFMSRNDRIVIAPDQDTHQQLGSVQGSHLIAPKITNWKPQTDANGNVMTDAKGIPLTGATPAPLLPTGPGASNYTATNADDVASAVRHVISSVKPSTPATAASASGTALGVAAGAAPRAAFLDMRQPPRPPRVDTVVTLRTMAHINRRAPINPDAFRASLGGNLGFSFSCAGGGSSLQLTLLGTQAEVDAARGVATPLALGGWLTGLWDDCKAAVNNFVAAVKVDLAIVGDVIHLAIHDIDSIYHSVVSTIDDALAAIGNFFQQLAVKLAELIQFLRELFDWREILRTHAVIKATLHACAAAAKARLSDSDAIRGAFAPLKNVFGGSVNVAPAASGASLTDTRNSQTAHPAALANADSVKGKAMRQRMQNQSPTAVGTSASPPPDTPSAAASTLDLSTILSGFETLGADMLTMSPSDLSAALAALFKTAGAEILDGAIDSFVAIAATLGDGIAAIVDGLDTTLDIPFISALYKWITGDDLSILDVLCLVIAIPINVVYAIVTAILGAESAFADDNAGMPDSLLAAAGVTSLGLAPASDPDASGIALGDATGGVTNLGIEVAFIILRGTNIAFVAVSDDLFIENREAGYDDATGGFARNMVKLAKGTTGMACTLLLYAYSNPRFIKRLPGTESPVVAHLSLTIAILSVVGDLITCGGGVSGISKGLSPARPVGEPVSGTVDSTEWALLGCVGAAAAFGIAWSIHNALETAEDVGVSGNLQAESALLRSRDVCFLIPRLFGWMYTNKAALGRPIPQYLTVLKVRLAANVCGLVLHAAGVLFDPELESKSPAAAVWIG